MPQHPSLRTFFSQKGYRTVFTGHFRLVSVWSATLALVLAPLAPATSAQSDSPLLPEAAFARKADGLLKQVRRAVAEDAAAERAGRLTLETSETEALAKSVAVTRDESGRVLIDVTVRLTQNSATELKTAGYAVGSRIGDVATVQVGAERLAELAALTSVRSLSASTYYQPSNDAARRSVGVENSTGGRNFPQRGRNVVVGVVDSGIDFRHPDFTVPGSNNRQTRVRALLDMTTYTDANGDGRDDNWDYYLPGASAPIGKLYTEADINAALQAGRPTNQNADIVKQRDRSGHGTHVSGTAAGNGSANSSRINEGIAPEADLVIVKACRTNTSSVSFRTSDVINGLKFVEQKAAELNEPFVINLSLGGHFGSHDGTLDDERAIDNLVNGASGRAVCIAAGNEGDEAVHAGGYLSAGGTASVTLTSTSSPQFVNLYYPTSDRFSVAVTRPDGRTVTSQPVPFSTSGYPGGTDGQYVDIYNTIDDKEDADPQNDQNIIFIGFRSGAQNLGSNWTFTIYGNSVSDGRFDAWAGAGAFTSYVDNSRHVSSPGTSRAAITVGAYNSRTFTLTTGELYTTGNYAAFTNPGPTADSRSKPDISAPGAYLVSSRSFDSSFTAFRGDTSYASLLGTSMATPVVTGCVALLFEANRNLSSEHLKSVLASNATSDSFTRPGWDARFGNGKLNVASAISAAVNINPDGNKIWDTRSFVRQQYLDFLNREPDAQGWNDWSNYTDGCPSGDGACMTERRVVTSSGFFRSNEFFTTGYFVLRLYKTSLARDPKYVEFVPDSRQLDYGVAGDQLEASKLAFASNWVNRPEFRAKYPDALPVGDFVNRLLQTANLQVSSAEFATLTDGGLTRAQIVSRVADNQVVQEREFNSAFVRMQYFGYLKRDPEPQGFSNWLTYLNSNPTAYPTMIWGFIYSPEYQSRFGYPRL